MSSGSGQSSRAVVLRGEGGVVGVAGARTKASERKLPPKQPLEEDEFTEALTSIVRRDFFPDIPKLEAQLEFIEASERNDYDKLRQISERFATTTHTPSGPAATPATFETPTASTPATKGKAKQTHPPPSTTTATDQAPPEAKKPKPGEDQSLDSFLAEYHSEDDASFNDLMEKARAEHQRRHAWLFEREAEANARYALEAAPQRLAITDGDGQGGADSERKPLAIDDMPNSVKTWGYTSKNSLMYIPEGVEESARERVEGARKERAIVHGNTRLSQEFLKKTQVALREAAGVEGAGPGRAGAVRDKVGVDGVVVGEADSPQVNGYGFVATPQIHPGVDASPLMTWGTIDGTPFRLETDVLPSAGPSFKIPQPPRREKIGHQLADKATKATRDRKKAVAQSASPAALRQKLGTTPMSADRLRLLSPAARKLVSRATTPGSRTDTALRASYTPKHTPSSSPSTTPRATPTHKPSGGSVTPSLTDNLLNLKSQH